MITLPYRTLQTRTDASGRTLVRDPVRRKWVRLTPEEEVRQQLLHHLISLDFPVGLLAVERAVTYLGHTWRADVVAYDRHRNPLLLVECKAPEIPIDKKAFDQLARYNASLGAQALLATNGRQTLMCIQREARWRFVDALPQFRELARGA